MLGLFHQRQVTIDFSGFIEEKGTNPMPVTVRIHINKVHSDNRDRWKGGT
ncbi:MAG: hypothetical protein K0S80_94 [Neobacillus sp.]|jgi:hypothetical protein|nr:hypothetical protein [Neobacillus sp.]